MTLYLGIPDEEWHLHLSEAEELLVEDNIGTHILGVYPYGNRIYGQENRRPGLLCLYFNDPAELLDPCNQDSGHHMRSVGQGCNPVRFVSLYAWAQAISTINNPFDEFHENLCHLIPPMGAPLYEDPQLTILMDLAREYLGIRGWDRPAFKSKRPYDEVIYISYLRMRLILEETGKFTPCLNTSWCSDVVSLKNIIKGLSKNVLRFDDNLIAYCSGEISDLGKGLDLFEAELRILLTKQLKYQTAKKEKEALGEAIRNLYRNLL